MIENAKREALHGFVGEHAQADAMKYTDELLAYQGLENHEAVKHSISEWVRDQAHTNGIESFWALLKRGYYGTFHHVSPKHLHRYVSEFAGRHNVRDKDTIDQMRDLVAGMTGKRLMYSRANRNRLSLMPIPAARHAIQRSQAAFSVYGWMG